MQGMHERCPAHLGLPLCAFRTLQVVDIAPGNVAQTGMADKSGERGCAVACLPAVPAHNEEWMWR